MTTPITQDQWNALRAQGHTDATIMHHYHVAPTMAPPAPPVPGFDKPPGGHSRANDLDNVTGDDAVFRRPRLPEGSRVVTVIGVEGPVSTAYGDAVFVSVRDEQGDEFVIKHKYSTAIEQNITRQSIACLVAASGVPSFGALRQGCSTSIRVNATAQIAAGSRQPYVRVDYLSASAPEPSSVPISAPALSMPPMPAPAAAPSLPPMPIMPAPAPTGLPSSAPPGWMGAWPPGSAS